MINFKGIASAILSGMTFGLNPLFALPLLSIGMGYGTILMYRYLIAAAIMAVILLITKSSFRLTRGEAKVLIILSVFYMGSSYFLFWSYEYLSSGVATSIIFLYPVLVTSVMMIFFKYDKSPATIAAVILATLGVAVLSLGEYRHGANIIGVLIALMAALSYALFVIGTNRTNVSKMPSFKLTFYILFFGGTILTLIALVRGADFRIPNLSAGINLTLLALIPTVVSNAALVYALKNVGSIITSVMGATEPFAAVAVGVLVFGEPWNENVIIGICLIIFAVCLVIFSGRMDRHIKALTNNLIGHLGIEVE
ncbi:drug/metabolite transporter (DMT)-like permease [Elusimicrobium posterum]|uniref:DMT family transporter n=1 Tax=Elusimicrobium posterum TaxID=3116653 RepID=UPI003C77799E